MHRKKPVSGKQHKAQLQAKRARKRVGSEPQDDVSSSALPNTRAPVISAQRRLESSFVRFSATLLDQSKAVAASVALVRPITAGAPIWSLHSGRIPSEEEAHMRAQMACMRRPKWKYEMSKKEVEKNEAGLFAKWLAKSDSLVAEWVSAAEKQQSSLAAEMPNAMPMSPSVFERNLEVWRQLWRVTETSQILMVLLDSRCPLLHLPPSLVKFISLPRYRVILVLTKVDISGPQRAEAWASYLRHEYPSTRVVMVESYSITPQGFSGREGIARRGRHEPHIPRTFKEQLVTALKEAHHEMLQPPEGIKDDPEKMSGWRPRVKVEVDWDVVLHSGPATQAKPARKGSDVTATDSYEAESDVLTIGLIGQPNVGKSSLLNALFGTTRVRASKTPGKTKHFQTLFWSPDIRLVDCPGLVLPDLVPMEMQGSSHEPLLGVLPIARMPAISLCIFFAAQLLPLEDILGLVHPSVASPPPEDKRTWREGIRRPQSSHTQEKTWTAMDLMTAYAKKRGWVTAKAGRPDISRAGNAILRFLAEGKIKWAFWPPGYDESHLPDANAGYGIWVPSEVEDPDPDPDDDDEGSDDGDGDGDSDDPETGGESSGSNTSQSYQTQTQTRGGPPSVPGPKSTELGQNTSSDPPVLPPAASSHTNHATTATTTMAEAGAAPSSEQPQKRAFTAALNTPHDAVLAELQGHYPGHDPSARIDPTPSASVLGMQSLDTLPAATSEAPGSVVSSSSPPPESLYDPFTGSLIGALTQTSSAKRSGEELWAHLARIRALEAEVAGLHVTMEGIGLGEPAVPRLRSTTPRAVGERLADDEDSDGDGGSEVEERRALEFERAERRFDGRKEEIEQIMTKLDELSQALAAFHALDTPGVNFTAASRSTTMSTAAPLRHSTLRHPHLRRISSDTSVRGREEIFDSPASLQAPLPNVQEPESDAEPADPDTPIS